jgi:hypothetical protein
MEWVPGVTMTVFGVFLLAATPSTYIAAASGKESTNKSLVAALAL